MNFWLSKLLIRCIELINGLAVHISLYLFISLLDYELLEEKTLFLPHLLKLQNQDWCHKYNKHSIKVVKMHKHCTLVFSYILYYFTNYIVYSYVNISTINRPEILFARQVLYNILFIYLAHYLLDFYYALGTLLILR